MGGLTIYFVVGVFVLVFIQWLYADDQKGNETCLAGISLLCGIAWPLTILGVLIYGLMSLLERLVKFFQE